jgi:hypothetical protein
MMPGFKELGLECCGCGGGHGSTVAVSLSDRLVGDRVDATPAELLLDDGVPEVLDIVVRPPRQPRRDLRPSARGHKFEEQLMKEQQNSEELPINSST